MPAATVDDVLAQLDAIIDRCIAEGDRLGYFAVLYRKVTARVKDGLAEDLFDDPARMERLDVRFAQRYLDAVAAHAAGQPATASWRLTFDAAPRWRPLLLQHLLVGINAHINLDLGIAAVETSAGDELPGLRRDYDRINGVLAAMIASVQDDLRQVSPWMGVLDAFGARTQTELVRFSIITARTGAWGFAQQLAATPADGWERVVDDRDRAVARVGRMVLHPGTWASTGLLIARLRESDDVAANLRLLLEAREPTLDEVARAADDPTLTPDA